MSTLIKKGNKWITVAGGTRLWTGTTEQLKDALEAGDLLDYTTVMVTDDYEAGGAGLKDDWYELEKSTFQGIDADRLHAYWSPSRRVLKFDGHLSFYNVTFNKDMVSTVLTLTGVPNEGKGINTACSCSPDSTIPISSLSVTHSEFNSEIRLSAYYMSDVNPINGWLYIGAVQL